MEKFFKLKQHNTTVGTELSAGLITFMTMAYILAVNPSILSSAGMDSTAAIPAYLCIISMVLFYSISNGIAIGIVSYVIIHALCGKAKEVNPLMYVLALLFILNFIFL